MEGNYGNTKLELHEEASIHFYIPVKSNEVPTRNETVFYNPVQRVNRDISVLFLKSFIDSVEKNISLSEPFCATGIRSLRYYLQTKLNFGNFYVSDVKTGAVDLARKNFELNNITSGVIFEKISATAFFSRKIAANELLDIIDIDPFGSPAPFIIPALLALKRGGVLCLTATDTAVLAGVYPSKAYRRYGITSIVSRIPFVHEMAIRCFIAAIQRMAMHLEISLHPVLAYHADHYIRVFFQKSNKPGATLRETGYVGYCKNCGEVSHATLEETGKENFLSKPCNECKGVVSLIGPQWFGNLADHEIIKKMIDNIAVTGISNAKKTLKVLSLLEEEVNKGPELPYFHDIHVLAKQDVERNSRSILKKRDDIIARLIDAGYKASRTHCKPTGIKTDAPVKEIKEFLW